VIAENIVADGSIPEEEVLSVVDVPPGKMGRVIGRRGASILSIKQSCEYVSFLQLLMCALLPIEGKNSPSI